MTDSAPFDDPADPLTFTPVPAASARRDGFTPARQREFIVQLARIGVVSAAAKAVGMSAKSAYGLRKRAGEESSFAAAWDAAVEEGRTHALDLSIERAIQGEVIPVFYRGRRIGSRVRYDNRLIIAALRRTHRDRYAAPAPPFDDAP